MVLQGHLGELSHLVAETERFCREHGLGDEVEFELNLVLEELFANSVRHGGCEGMAEAAHVRIELRDDGVHVEYADRGRPFDPLSAPVPDLQSTLEERQIGGLGVHLVRQLMRDLNYRRDGDWNRTTMRRPVAGKGRTSE